MTIQTETKKIRIEISKTEKRIKAANELFRVTELFVVVPWEQEVKVNLLNRKHKAIEAYCELVEFGYQELNKEP
jgi:hypothetical protein